MRLFDQLPRLACALAAAAACAGPALAQEATDAAPAPTPAEVVAEVVPAINAGDTAWMSTPMRSMSFRRTAMSDSFGARSCICLTLTSRVSALAYFTDGSYWPGLRWATFAETSGLA